MPREKIPYEEVARVCDVLRAQGTRPGQRVVMAQTGGSAKLVLEHIRTWKSQHPEAAAPAPTLNAGIARLLSEEIGRIEAQARLNAEERLREVEEANEELMRESGRLDQENESLQQLVAALTGERDQLRGQVRQQTTDIERLQQQLKEVQDAAKATSVALAKAELKADSQKEIADSLRNERDSLRKLNEEERAGRVEAEKALAGADGSLQELRKNLDKMIELYDEVEAERAEMQKSLDAERGERAKFATQLAACQAEAKAAKERADDLQRREGELRSELQRRETVRTPLRTGAREDPSKPRSKP